MAYLNFRFVKDISTYVTFTCGGPRAYAFGDEDLEVEKEKLQSLIDVDEE